MYLAVVSLFDFKQGRIPNLITLIFFLVALLTDVFTDPYKIPLKLSCAAFFFLLFYATALFSKGLGLGDVKLAAVVGYCAGFFKTSISLILACMIGIIFFMIRRVYGKKIERVPFAPFVAMGYTVSVIIYRRIL